MKKVAIDTSCLESAHLFRGVGVYTQKLIEALGKLKKKPLAIEPVDFKKVGYQQLVKHYSLLHYSYFDPFFLSLPLRKKLATVVTIHDLIPLVFPKHFPKGIRGWLKYQWQKQALKDVKRIITVSQHSKKDIMRILKIPEEKIRVIYEAQGEQFRPLSQNDKLLGQIKNKCHLPERFVLYVGDLNWNKNIPGLIKAFQATNSEELKLVLVGKAFQDQNLKELKELKDLIKKLKLEDKVMMLGFIPVKDLVAIYNQAAAYCQPSFYEGFGFPVLESMACGCPVACSKRASLPEIAGQAAIFVNPKDPTDIAQGLKKVLDFSKEERQKIVEKGLAHARQFSWQKTARETLSVYREVLDEG